MLGFFGSHDHFFGSYVQLFGYTKALEYPKSRTKMNIAQATNIFERSEISQNDQNNKTKQIRK